MMNRHSGGARRELTGTAPQRLATARNGSQRLATKYSARKSKLFLGDDRNPRLRLDVVGVRVTDNQ
jgi:hypothetical protein